MEINHSTHPHPLFLFLGEASNTEGVCFICRESIVGNPFYVCEDCKFYVHKQCAELPSVIDHPFHPQHPLRLRHGGEFSCDSCHKIFEEKPHFSCNTCNFDLDVECALMPKINPEGEEFIQHFSHQHPMSLCSQDHDKFLICFACKKITSEVVYGCIPCDYFLHESCSELPTPVLHTLHPQHALHLQLKYGRCRICNIHDHTFKFICGVCRFTLDVSCWMEYTWKKVGQNLEGNCFICSKQHLDSISCVDSKYLLNQTCIWLPKEINHQFHSHKPLQLLAPEDLWCESCHKWFDPKSCYGCDDCNFHMDVKCALMPKINPEGEEFVQHFSHQHPMSLRSQDHDKFSICFACKKITSEVVYGCIPCEYFLHKSCSELPTSVLHTLHPQHPLHLQLKYCLCQICNVYDHTFKFICVVCRFSLDVSCWMEYTWKKKGQNLEGDCFICSKQHLDSISCVDSKYLLNQTCIWLPKEINHQFHSHKPLQLLAPKDFWCDSCHKWFDTKLCYGCCDSNFHMDVKCALMPSVQYNEGDKYFDSFIPHYFSHQHPLCLITQDFGIICFVCQMTRPSAIYGCLQCEYVLHQSCIELPSKIESPLHSHHKLTMELVHNEYCHLCLKKYSGFFFGCIECTFYIGIECYSLIPKFNVRYAYHEHLLCLVEKSYCEKCDSNYTFCGISKFSREFQLTQTYLLRCVQCNYNVHLLCGPLPFTIKDKNHLHGLTLADCVVEDDCDEYYCDICEEEREPRLCVYYCKDCDFVSHVHCVMSEILSALKKYPGQVELRIARDLNLEGGKYQPYYNASGNVLNLKNILDSLSEDETKEIEDYFPSAKLYGKDEDYSETEDEGESTSRYEGSDIIQEFSMYNNPVTECFVERIYRFQLGRKYHIQPHEYELEVVEVKDCMITSNFASLLSALFMKYGDFSAHTRFQKNFKSVIFYLFCRMVDDLRRTCLVDFTERQLVAWAYYFNGVSSLGFKIYFACPFQGTTLLSFMGLQAMKLEGELPDKVALEIADLESEIQRRKSYLLQFKPRNDQSRVYATKDKWRTVAKDII